MALALLRANGSPPDGEPGDGNLEKKYGFWAMDLKFVFKKDGLKHVKTWVEFLHYLKSSGPEVIARGGLPLLVLQRVDASVLPTSSSFDGCKML